MTDKEYNVLTSLAEDWRREAEDWDGMYQYKVGDVMLGMVDQLEHIVHQLRRDG